MKHKFVTILTISLIFSMILSCIGCGESEKSSTIIPTKGNETQRLETNDSEPTKGQKRPVIDSFQQFDPFEHINVLFWNRPRQKEDVLLIDADMNYPEMEYLSWYYDEEELVASSLFRNRSDIEVQGQRFSIGDTVTITVEKNISDEEWKKLFGSTISQTKKDYIVESLYQNVTSIDEITDEAVMRAIPAAKEEIATEYQFTGMNLLEECKLLGTVISMTSYIWFPNITYVFETKERTLDNEVVTRYVAASAKHCIFNSTNNDSIIVDDSFHIDIFENFDEIKQGFAEEITSDEYITYRTDIPELSSLDLY